MENNNLLILEYQDNFADNLSIYAYGKILEKKQKRKCFYENNIQKRVKFENSMAFFNLDCGYISTNRVKNLTKEAFYYNQIIINDKKIDKEIKSKKSKNKILDLKHFKIDDIPLITDDILKALEFNNCDFVKNYILLEEISTVNSIGVYVSPSDVISNGVDWEYISKSAYRLNKYIKKPVLYVFSTKDISNNINVDIKTKFICLNDWKEEFYLLSACKHKILLDSPMSYSENFWSIVLNQKEYYLNAFNKKLKVKNKPLNWIRI